MKRLLYIATLLIGVCILWACSSTPSGVLSKEKMARLLADLYIAETVVEQNRSYYSDDSVKKLLKQSVLKRHKVTSEQVDTSLRWYGYNMEKYVEIHERVIEILEKEITTAQATAGSNRTSENGVLANTRYVVDGDSVDVWPDVHWRRFSRLSPSDIMSFVLTTDQHWERGDIYDLSARLTSAPGATELTIVAEYQDGSKDYSTVRQGGDGWKRTSLALNPDKTASTVYGTILYNPAGKEEAFIDSISLVRTRNGSRHSGITARQKHLSNRYGR